VALGARLGVGQDPVEVLALSAVLGDPLAHHVARHLRQAAAEISMFTGNSDVGCDRVCRVTDCSLKRS
jgi:hypothetical protein